MLISTKGRYALRVLADLGSHQREGFIPLAEIAEREGISSKYLESIVKSMVRAGLLVGQRGKGGGYRLTRTPEEYTVHEVLLLTEGNLAPVSCLDDDSPCPHGPSCPSMVIWRGLDELIAGYLSNITLADFMSESARGDNYVI